MLYGLEKPLALHNAHRSTQFNDADEFIHIYQYTATQQNSYFSEFSIIVECDIIVL